jgi:tetratricopeptide (TPR) repeat protein
MKPLHEFFIYYKNKSAFIMQKLQLIKKLILLVFTLSISYSNSCMATWPSTDKDFSLLPPFCKSLIDEETKKREYAIWQKRIGVGFGHAHHFCAGLHTYRLIKNNYNLSESEKNSGLDQVLKEVQYYLTNAGPKSRLHPAAYLQMAQAYADMGNISKAIEYFNKSIDSNKKYVKAYLGLAEFYLKVNSLKQAIETIKIGLQYKPDSIALNRKLKKLQEN